MTWSKTEIRLARKLPLAPLLQQRGLTLHELPGDNYRVERFGDLVVRDHFWNWKSHQLQGNTIDFFILVENLSFAQAMELLCPKTTRPTQTATIPSVPPDPDIRNSCHSEPFDCAQDKLREEFLFCPRKGMLRHVQYDILLVIDVLDEMPLLGPGSLTSGFGEKICS